jgi:hypothetical protein
MVSKFGSSSATWVNRWEITSMTSDRTYVVGQKVDGTWGCDCAAWKFHKAPKPPCKHILKVQAVESVDTSYTPTIDRDIPLSSIKMPTARDFQAAHEATRTAKAPAAPVFLLQTRRNISLED